MVVRRVVKYGLFVWGYDAVSDTGQWVVVISVCDVLSSAVLSLLYTGGGRVCTVRLYGTPRWVHGFTVPKAARTWLFWPFTGVARVAQ